jgi:hypothetical protein
MLKANLAGSQLTAPVPKNMRPANGDVAGSSILDAPGAAFDSQSNPQGRVIAISLTQLSQSGMQRTKDPASVRGAPDDTSRRG